MNHLQLHRGRLSDFSRWLLTENYSQDYLETHGILPMAGGASFSDYLENKILDHIFNDSSYTAPTAYLGLWTSALADNSTGSTSGEASATNYARYQILASDMSAAASGSKTNSATITMQGITGSSSTITYWGTFDAATTGNMLVWGTATSTVISATQTPPTIAASGLTVTLD